MRIAGKVVLITGASEGIGSACAREFARRGAKVAITARSEAKLRDVPLSRGREGAETLILPADLTHPSERQSVIERTADHFGGLDVLINNAGVLLYAPSWQPPDAETRHMFELNFFAPLDLVRLAVPFMKARGGGLIVNVSSIAGKVTLPWLTLYSASKSALAALTDGQRMELRSSGIRFVTVCPGYVRTAIQDHPLAGAIPEPVRRAKKMFAITAAECARDIANGVEREARTVMSPRAGWLFLLASRLLPGVVDARMSAIYPGKETPA